MILAIIAALLLLPLPAVAAESRVEAVHVTAATAARTLNDDLWEKAPVVSDFVQREPSEGATPSQLTEFRVAFDTSTLYVKVRAYDREPEKIVTYLTRRDDDSPCDWIRVLIDSYHDRLSGYAGAIAFNKIGGEFVHSNSYVYFRSPGFETNDLGFLRRADQIRQQHWLQLRSNRVTHWFRQRTINFNE